MTTRLALLFLRGSGRRGAVRLTLLVAGSALGVWCLLVALAFPSVLEARQERAAGRSPVAAIAGGDHTSYRVTTARVDGREATVVLLAPGTVAGPVPPGLRGMPSLGTAAVSPALDRLLATSPTARAAFAHDVSDVIATPGLVAPDELYAYAVVDDGALRDQGLPLAGFGVSYRPDAELSAADLRLARIALVALVGFPLAVYFSVCARLSSARRDRRLVALRRLGMSVPAALRVNAVEAVVAAAAGAVVGLGAYEATRGLVARGAVGGLRWFPADARPSAAAVVACLAGVPAVAAVLGALGARSGMAGGRLAARTPSPSLWPLVPFGVGVAMLLGILVPAYARPAGVTPTSPLVMLVSVAVTAVGLAIGFGPLAAAVARRVAARTERPSLLLGMRRLAAEPAAATRVVAGLVVVVFAAGFASGMLRDARAAASPLGDSVAHRVDAAELPRDALRRLAAAPGVLATGAVLRSYTPAPARPAPAAAGATPGVAQRAAPRQWPVSFLVASCADLRVLAGAPLPECADGRGYVLANEGSRPANPSLRPGATVPLLRSHAHAAGAPGGHAHRAAETVAVPVPERVLVLPARALPLVTVDVVLPPAAFAGGELPDGSDVVLASGTGARAIAQVVAAVAAVAPDAEVVVLDGDVDARRRAETLRGVLVAALSLGLLVGLLAFVVAAADRAVERRGGLMTLQAFGVPRRTLRVAQASVVAVPLAVGVLMAVSSAKLAEQATVVVGGFARDWTWSGPARALLLGLGVTVVAGFLTTLAVPRRIDVSLVRRE